MAIPIKLKSEKALFYFERGVGTRSTLIADDLVNMLDIRMPH